MEYIEVTLEEGSSREHAREIEASKLAAKAVFPIKTEIFNPDACNCQKSGKTIQSLQFPSNIANARTGHESQGKSLENMFVSNWSHTTNWVCVVSSRVKTIKGSFMRLPLNTKKMNSEETVENCNKMKESIKFFRNTKSPGLKTIGMNLSTADSFNFPRHQPFC